MLKDGSLTLYNKEFQKFLDRGVLVTLTREEINSYTGPINYVTHHSVLKDSVTTPIRIVSNSSTRNNGTSLNKCLVKGPDSLNPLLQNLIMLGAMKSVSVMT